MQCVLRAIRPLCSIAFGHSGTSTRSELICPKEVTLRALKIRPTPVLGDEYLAAEDTVGLLLMQKTCFSYRKGLSIGTPHRPLRINKRNAVEVAIYVLGVLERKQ